MKLTATFIGVGAGALLLCGSASAFSDLGNSVLLSDGSAADTQAAINAARNGSTVRIPTGTFNWTSSVRVQGKAIHLQGAGSGRIIARSASVVTVGSGSKAFETQSGLAITGGQTLRVERTGDIGNWMQGTVTSYSGTTLTLNVTSTGGSGSQKLWIISTLPQTIIEHNAGASALLELKSAIELSGICFRFNGGSGTMINLDAGPSRIHDCWFRSADAGVVFLGRINSGVIYNCSFDSSPFSMSKMALQQKMPASTGSQSTWASLSTMGVDDLGGTNNIYVEDCDFHAFISACDFDDNARAVWRHNLMNNAGVGSHGADSSDIGVRHYEVYNNEFVFNDLSPLQTFNVCWWFWMRGGTGLIASNTMPNIISEDYGDKPELRMTILNLQRDVGPHNCWGAGIAGIQYPCPRQLGLGRVTGAWTNDTFAYCGDSEPVYIWRNTGGGSQNPSIENDSPAQCADADNTSDYIVENRDFFVGTAKPGWVPYTYPHPLRRGSSRLGGPLAPPRNLVVQHGG